MLHDIRYALRALRSSPGFTLVAILSLALGIGANTAIFSLIDAAMLKYLPVDQPQELVQITNGSEIRYVSNFIWEQLRDRQDIFAGILAYSPASYNLSPGGEARNIRGDRVSGHYFDTLGIKAILGRTLTPEDDKPGAPAAAVLGYDFWQSEYGGSASVLEKTILLDGYPFAIVGVLPPGFFGLQRGRDISICTTISTEPLASGELNLFSNPNAAWLDVVARLKPGVSLEQVKARLKILAPQIFAVVPLPTYLTAEGKAQFRNSTLGAIPAGRGSSRFGPQYELALLVLMGIVGAVLLIACANVANLLLARATTRQREIAIRLAIGAGRARLIRQLLTESLLLSISGTLLGLVFAQWGSRLLVNMMSSTNARVYLNLSLDLRMLAFTIAIAFVTAILFGLAPAWRGTRVDPNTAMKANSRGAVGASSRFSLSKSLVVIQVSLSLVLVVGAGLLLSTFFNLSTMDPGFRPDNVLVAKIDLHKTDYSIERRVAAYVDIQNRLRAIPGVRSASFSILTPVDFDYGFMSEQVSVDGQSSSRVANNRISAGYFATIGTPLLAGRDFDAHDTQGSPAVAIINETMARKFFGDPAQAIGRTYHHGTPLPSVPARIIGVVGDAKYTNLRQAIPPTTYYSQAQRDGGELFNNFEISFAGPASSMIPSVRAAFADVNPNITLAFHLLTTQLADSIGRERLLATLSGFFGSLALLLAMLGLYGVMSYNVARRKSEIGIRMALGAEQSRVMRMVLGEVALLIGIGLVIGFAVALMTTRFVTSFLYGLKPNDPWTLCAAAAILASVAALSGYLPAHRASKLDPMSALREE